MWSSNTLLVEVIYNKDIMKFCYFAIIMLLFTILGFPGGWCLSAMRETWVWSLGWEDSLEKEMAPHSSILAWRIPWTEEPGGLQSMGWQRVGHNWATSLSLSFTILQTEIQLCNCSLVVNLQRILVVLQSLPQHLFYSRKCQYRGHTWR